MGEKIVVSVGIASYPISSAGNTWNSLNWALGFRELGWDVWIVENLNGKKCVDANWQPSPPETSANVWRWRQIIEQFGFQNRSTLLIDDEAADLDALRDFANEADLFLNLSGHFKSKAVSFEKALKIYQDGDPAYSQIWASEYKCDMNFAGHDRFISAGLKLGREGSFAPTCGIEWLPTFPPVVLRYWPYSPLEKFSKFSTIAHWTGYSSCQWNGQWFHGKREEFRKIIDVPSRISKPAELACQLTNLMGELEPYQQAGWLLADANEVCASLENYADYIAQSSAEFSVAKHGYVISRAAWFSDRAVCYAAMGKPLVLQDTNTEGLLPFGEGYHPFNTPDEAAAACERVISDFPAQQLAARKLAETYFDSNVVIRSLLDRL